jgi:DNA mismatch endonuclease, patch repair protein
MLAKGRVKVVRNVRSLPGSPDLALPWFRIAVFVHGCFWHGHSCRRGALPTTRPRFWAQKIEGNQRRDRRVRRRLRALGWRTFVIWECRTRDSSALQRRVAGLLRNRGNER